MNTKIDYHDLADGQEFSADGGRTWHVCAVPLFGNVAVYLTDDRDPDNAPTTRIDIADHEVMIRTAPFAVGDAVWYTDRFGNMFAAHVHTLGQTDATDGTSYYLTYQVAGAFEVGTLRNVYTSAVTARETLCPRGAHCLECNPT